MNTISLKRIKLLLLADWYELKEYFLWGFLAVSSIFLAIMVSVSDFSFEVSSLTMIIAFLLLTAFAFGMNFVNYRSNSIKGLGFLTPVRPVEKFLAQAIVLLFLSVSCIMVYILIAGLYLLIRGRTGGEGETLVYAVQSVFSAKFISYGLLSMMLVHWLGCLTFKKRALFKSLLIVAVIIYAVMNMNTHFIDYLREIDKIPIDTKVSYYQNENIYPGVLGILNYRILLFITFVLTMLYIGYLKLKEKEQR